MLIKSVVLYWMEYVLCDLCWHKVWAELCFRLTGKDPQAYSVYPDCLVKQLIGSIFHSGDVMHVSSVLYLM
jgi:hypothetical protein